MTFAACGDDEHAARQRALALDSAAWHVAVLPTLDCMPLYVAAERGFFDEAGVPVRLEVYQAQMDVDTALLRNRVVGAVTDLARVEHLRQQGMQLECVSATDACWQLMSKRSARIVKLPQLDDKMMAMTRYSATDMLSDLVVDTAKLKPERVFRIQVNDIGVRLGMLQADIMDAMFLPEPQATVGRNLKGKVLLDTRKLDLWLGTIAFQADSLKGQDKRLKAFTKAYDRAVDSLNESGMKNYRQLMERCLNVNSQTLDSLPADFRFRHAAKPRQKDVESARKWWEKRVESMKYVERRYIQ